MGYTDGLGKFPRMLAVGEPLTREQTNEVMMRTNDWYYVSCNDEEWEGIVGSILGWFDRFEELVEAGECADSWTGWWDAKRRIGREYGRMIGSLNLGYVDNEAIMSHGSLDPGMTNGWLNWDGTIRGDWSLGVKYPEVEEITEEWVRVAQAFPFLRMHVQALSCGWGAEGAAPKDTIVAEWFIRDGRVHFARLPWQLPRKAYKRPAPLRRPRRRDGKLADLWWKCKYAKIVKPLREAYYKVYRWRHDAHLNFAFFPRPFDWGMASFEERHVSAARLIDADDQMRGKR